MFFRSDPDARYMEFESFVLAAVTSDITEAPRAHEDADALEFRMDLTAEDPLAALNAYTGPLPIIATNRLQSEGGNAPAGDSRIETLCAATEHDAVTAVDIELASVKDGDGHRVVEHARAHEVAVIVSAHDFDTTPSTTAMRRILTDATGIGDVGKLSTTATTTRHALDLLTVTLERTEAGDHIATMAMGELGQHTRAVAPVYGSRIGYAPLTAATATAPGQYDLATLRSLIDALL